ncbi:MAG: DUF456 domain-containing protein [Lentisphaeria bacterium]|nr:DUF456 domain-containing protein [Lentisphaeria bacterium]
MEFTRLFFISLGYVFFYLTMLLGVVLVPLGLPGEFLIVIAAGVFIAAAGSGVISWWTFLGLLLLGVLAETIEFFAGLLGAKVKGSLWSGVGAIIGGVAGAVLGAPFGLIIGSLAGVFVGTFLGAYLVELHISKQSDQAMTVAGAAVAARLIGVAVKVTIAVVMILLVTLALIVQ